MIKGLIKNNSLKKIINVLQYNIYVIVIIKIN